MENKTKILAFAAVALMFAVCFIGFVAINDGEVNAEDVKSTVVIDGKETSYGTLVEAWNYAVEQSSSAGKQAVVTLGANESGGGLTIPDGHEKKVDIILNLGGNTYTISKNPVGSKNHESQGLHLKGKDSANSTVVLKNGTITSVANSGVKMLIQNYVNLTLDNITLDGTKLDLSDVGYYTLSHNSSESMTTTINPGVTIIAHDGGYAFNVDKKANMVINGGTFNGKVAMTSSGTLTVNGDLFNVPIEHTNGTLTVNGGAYPNDPTSSVKDGEVKTNPDGAYSKYVVNPSASITSGNQTVYYDSISNAVANAGDKETVKVLRDVDLYHSSVVVTKSVTIDLNGKKIESSALVFDIMGKDVAFTIDANGGSISTTGSAVVWTNNGKDYANPNVNVKGGTYSGNYVFLNYAQCGSFSIDKAVVNGKSAGIWFGNGPALNASITDSTIVATGMGIYLGTVKEAILSNVKVTGGTGIEIKSGDVVINGDSIIKATADYKEDLDMNNNGSGGSVAAICINNAYVGVTKKEYSGMTYVSVSIADSVKIESKSNDQKMICITSGYEHDTTNSIENTPIYVNSDLNIEKIGILCKGTANSPVKSPIIYNGVAYAFNQYMYNVVKSDSNVNGYDISLAEGVKLTVGTVNGTVTLAKGAELTITNDSTFTGTINGPDNNKLVANGMKAGEGGIVISASDKGFVINGSSVSGSMIIEKGTDVSVKDGGSFSFGGIVDNKGKIMAAADKFIVNGELIMVAGSSLVIDGKTTIGEEAFKFVDDTASLTIKKNANGGYDKILSGGSAISEIQLIVGENDTFKIAKDSTLTALSIKVADAKDLIVEGKLVMVHGSELIENGKTIIGKDVFELNGNDDVLMINTNSKGGFDATLNGKATASKLDVWINDTFTVAKGAELTMTGTFLNAGNVTIDGTLLMTDAGKLQVMKNGIVTINGTIDGGIIDITNVDKDVVCVLFKPNSTITSKIDGTDDDKTSIVVLFGIKAGKGGVSVTKGSVIVDGALVEGDVTVPSGSTSFVYGTLEPGATLTIENNAAVNPTGSGSLVVESGAKVVTNNGASIKSVTYKAGSELNGTTFDTDTRVTPEGNVLVAIKIYLNYDNKKLNVSADYVEAFAGDKYVDVLSGVTVSGVNSRITFSGWYNSLDEKITSDVVVPSGGADVILTAHFTEKAKNTVINTGSNDGVDYSVVIAFIVLIGSMIFLCSVLRKR